MEIDYRTIVVIGMHRSGTSMVANIVQKCGINMGEVFRLPDKHNPYGYYEDLDWRAANKWIINTAVGSWFDQPSKTATAGVATTT